MPARDRVDLRGDGELPQGRSLSARLGKACIFIFTHDRALWLAAEQGNGDLAGNSDILTVHLPLSRLAICIAYRLTWWLSFSYCSGSLSDAVGRQAVKIENPTPCLTIITASSNLLIYFFVFSQSLIPHCFSTLSGSFLLFSLVIIISFRYLSLFLWVLGSLQRSVVNTLGVLFQRSFRGLRFKRKRMACLKSQALEYRGPRFFASHLALDMLKPRG